MGFNLNRIRNVDFNFSSEDVEVLKKDWQSYTRKKQQYPNKFKGKGIVFTAGGVGYLTCAFVSISLLRKNGCKLPIEIWHRGNEISREAMYKFASLGVMFRDFFEVERLPPSGYALKPLAIIHSKFEEVLFMDADNNCVSDPEYLFSSAGYVHLGSMFWPDYWYTSKKNSIWEIIDSEAYDIPEQESGQLLVNKKKCWKELQLCLYFNKLSTYYYKILLGDKDTFKFAWHALNTPYFMISKSVGSSGYLVQDKFYGHTMVQHDEHDDIVFLHRNLMKWDITKNSELTWELIKGFVNSNRNGNVIIQPAPKGNIAIDLRGETKQIIFSEKFPELESNCIGFLDQWRESKFFKDFLIYSHFAKNRFVDGKEFRLDEMDQTVHV